jgi:hypothetical protein
MTTETISGKCPCCGYDKLIQHYGSHGAFNLEACASCGFGYSYYPFAESKEEMEDINEKLWCSESFANVLIFMFQFSWDGESQVTQYPSRLEVFKEIEKIERFNDIEKTIFKYPSEFIASHQLTMKPYHLMSEEELEQVEEQRFPAAPIMPKVIFDTWDLGEPF